MDILWIYTNFRMNSIFVLPNAIEIWVYPEMQINLTQFKLEFDLGLVKNYAEEQQWECVCALVISRKITHRLSVAIHNVLEDVYSFLNQ